MSTAGGRIYFVGAGPGDPGLLTLRGAEVLARCDVVLHDDVDAEVLAHAARAALRSPAGADVAAVAVAHAREGKIVGRVVGGDPTFLSQASVEIEAARAADVPFEVVPGVPALVAAGSHAGVAFTGADVAFGARTFARVVDGDAAIGDAADALAAGGLDGSMAAVAIARASMPSQRIVVGTLATIAREARGSGATVIVAGEAADPARRRALGWFEGRPLSGKRVLVTRAREQAASTAALLRERGAEAVVHPTIAIHPPADVAATARAIAAIGSYAYVAFTSANGVERAWRAIVEGGGDARAFASAKIAAIGPGTAQALEAHGLRADVVAKEFRGEGLAAAILAAMPSEPAARRVLLLRAQVARDALPDALRDAGCVVDVVPVYETRPAPAEVTAAIASALARGDLDAVTFTSSSTVDNLCDLLGPTAAADLARTRVASIGPITTATAERRGVHVDVTAREYTVRGLVDALEASFASELDGGGGGDAAVTA
jgi:uroporphyrinogen III methyltransferase/synthase